MSERGLAFPPDLQIAYYRFNIDSVLAFWIAYILTRPLGASMGDLLAQPPARGGLGFGTTVTSGIFLVVIVGLVTYLTVKADRVFRPSPES